MGFRSNNSLNTTKEEIKMNNLTHIMNTAGSDKGNGFHNYTNFYSQLFEPKRMDKLNLLEIGIGTLDARFSGHMGYLKGRYTPGASLRGWRDYFPNAQIYGCDIDKNVLFSEDRIETFYLDQTDEKSLRSQILDNDITYDIIIDDGMHHFPTNFNVLKQIYCKLNPGGYYIIEDVKDFDDGIFYGKFIRELSIQGHFCSYVRVANPYNTIDNNLIVLKTN